MKLIKSTTSPLDADKHPLALEIVTNVVAVISEECQSGKTTWVINSILDKQDCDHFLFTYDKHVVKQDALEKFNVEAKKRSLSPTIITNKKDLKVVYKDRLKGDYYPIICVLLGNISNFAAAKSLLSMSKKTNIPQHVYLDEIHRYTLGEEIASTVQIDNFVNELLKNNQCDHLWCISATAHDLLHTKLVLGKQSLVLTPYPGFKGLKDAQWHLVDRSVFEEVLSKYKAYKNNGIDSDLPEELKDIIDVFAAQDMLINLHPEQAFHEWMAKKIVDGGAYNGSVKSLLGNFIGKYSMSMSTTFPNHNKIIYYNKMTRSAQIGAIVQELGRVNGRKKPVIITTQEVKDAVLDYLLYNKCIVEEEVYKMAPKHRDTWLSSYFHRNPNIIPGSKHRQNRVITTFSVEEEGTVETCNELYTKLYIPDMYDIRWEGKGIGAKILKRIKETDPEIYNSIEGMSYITDTDTRDDGDIWHKQREGKFQVRFGKAYLTPGYVAIVVRKTMEKGFKSFYDVNGNLFTNKVIPMGFVQSVEHHQKMKEVEARVHAELQLLN